MVDWGVFLLAAYCGPNTAYCGNCGPNSPLARATGSHKLASQMPLPRLQVALYQVSYIYIYSYLFYLYTRRQFPFDDENSIFDRENRVETLTIHFARR